MRTTKHPLLALGVALLMAGGLKAQQPDSGVSVQNTAVQIESPEGGSNAVSATAGGNEAPASTGVHHDLLFALGHDVHLKAQDTAEAVVTIFGSAKVEGKVHDAVVTVFGNLDIPGEAHDAVVVMGDLLTGPKTRIQDSAVTVGGKQEVVEGARLGRNPTEVDFPQWFKGWVGHCLLLARPLSVQVGFVWLIALVFVLIYAFIAVLVPRPVQACVNELTTRPATTCLIGLLSLILLPLVLGILVATGLGIIVVPFLMAALVFAGFLGRVALLEWLGFSLVGHLTSSVTIKPLLALLIGAAIIAVLYLIPVVGLMTFAVTCVWGLGSAMLAAFGGLRRELPEKPTPPPSGTVPPYPAAEPSGAAGTVGVAGAVPGPGGVVTTPYVPPPPVLPDVLSYPKAGFWERMGAAFLDVVLIGVATRFGFHFLGPFSFLVAVAYFAGLWTWRGTSIGGIVLGLKVVRMDGQPVTFAVALVRALAAAFSVIVLFLGFLWIAWDPDKQGWHDKIAGTVVLKLPRGMPLLCL
jgi:uncharacterized RDD family membrane protein YckC